MKFNTKTRYGLRTMLELALNEGNEGGVYQKNISENQNVSIKYLDHIIAALKGAGLVENVAGKKSGYRLCRPANQISIYDVYAAFEKELAIIDCVLGKKDCPNKGTCVLRGFWCDLNDTIRYKMESISIGHLAMSYKHNGREDRAVEWEL